MRQAVLILLLAAPLLNAADITGKIIKVYDGDTIRIQDADGGKYKIRFADIDAPESLQEGGQEAKAFLEAAAAGKEVTVHFTAIDMYGRIAGTVRLPGAEESLNELLVRKGYAWHYAQYSKSESMAALEKQARAEKLGIWKSGTPQPPWEYRKQHKRK